MIGGYYYINSQEDVLDNITIGSGGNLYINNNVVISNGKTITVDSGGKINGNITIDGGILNTTFNVQLYNIYVTSDSELNLCYDNTTNKGATLVGSNTTIENGALKCGNTQIGGEIVNGVITNLTNDEPYNFGVKGGFTISGVTLSNGAIIYGEGGGNSFIDCTVNNNCSLFIGDQDIANNTIINSGGSLYISQGTINNTIISSGGSAMLYALNGNINDITLLEGAKLDMTFEDVPEYDPFEYSFIAGSNTNIASGTLYHAGFSVSGSCVNGVWTGLDGIYKLGIGSSITVESPIVGDTCRIYIKDGAIISGGQILENGNVSLFESGICYNISVGRPGAAASSYLNVYSGTANSTTVYQGGRFRLNASGIGSDTIVSSLGGVVVLPEGKLYTAIVSSGGSITVSSGGIAENITVSDCGSYTVKAGGIGNNTIISSGGSVIVSSTGNLSTVTVLSDGIVSNKGSIKDMTVSGGIVNISAAGKVSTTTILFGGSVVISNSGTIESMEILSGTLTVISSANSSASTLLYASNNGMIENMKVANGIVTISSNGILSSAKIYSGGSMLVSSGGIAENITVSNVGIFKVNGIGNNITVSSGGSVTVSSFGKLSSATILSSGSIIVSSNATGENIIVSEFGLLKVFKDGYISNLTLTGTSANVSVFNGLAISNTVNGRICICA